MGAADEVRSVIPWREQAVGAEEACKLFGLSREWFLRTVACRPGFPAKVHGRPARWVLGEVLDYRDAHRGELAA